MDTSLCSLSSTLAVDSILRISTPFIPFDTFFTSRRLYPQITNTGPSLQLPRFNTFRFLSHSTLVSLYSHTHHETSLSLYHLFELVLGLSYIALIYQTRTNIREYDTRVSVLAHSPPNKKQVSWLALRSFICISKFALIRLCAINANTKLRKTTLHESLSYPPCRLDCSLPHVPAIPA
ncbi:hypothetical protein BC827DRAFT_70188 [Russula dissimulans]|nr:hypothetical protein BC827DRAFT_70188 [Russula dissimulans]